jgi:hypothetical protein
MDFASAALRAGQSVVQRKPLPFSRPLQANSNLDPSSNSTCITNSMHVPRVRADHPSQYTSRTCIQDGRDVPCSSAEVSENETGTERRLSHQHVNADWVIQIAVRRNTMSQRVKLILTRLHRCQIYLQRVALQLVLNPNVSPFPRITRWMKRPFLGSFVQEWVTTREHSRQSGD